jgi:hypothetical protein
MNSYDIVIVSHEKDFNNIKHIIKYSQENLNFDSIHLILSEREEYREFEMIKSITPKPIFLHKESDVIKIDKEKISFRPNWIYQMLLKMFQNVTKNDNFLIIESDCLILKPLEFFDGNKTIFYLGRDYPNEPYFNFNKSILNIGREYDHSFICEFMMYDKKIIKDLLKRTNCGSVDDFIEIIYKTVNDDCYPADYELYGNFVYKFHNENFAVKKLNYHMTGRDGRHNPFWSEAEINMLVDIHKDMDAISFHIWGLN